MYLAFFSLLQPSKRCRCSTDLKITKRRHSRCCVCCREFYFIFLREFNSAMTSPASIFALFFFSSASHTPHLPSASGDSQTRSVVRGEKTTTTYNLSKQAYRCEMTMTAMFFALSRCVLHKRNMQNCAYKFFSAVGCCFFFWWRKIIFMSHGRRR